MGEWNISTGLGLDLISSKVYAIDDIMLGPISGVAEFTFEDITKVDNQSRNKKNAQVYVNGDVTTLKIGDKVYHSRPEKGEKFDLEKGILVCIAKASGYSTSDVLKLRENAKQHKKVAKKNTKNKKK